MTFPNSFCEANITLIAKPVRYYKKKNPQTNILKKICVTFLTE